MIKFYVQKYNKKTVLHLIKKFGTMTAWKMITDSAKTESRMPVVIMLSGVQPSDGLY